MAKLQAGVVAKTYRVLNLDTFFVPLLFFIWDIGLWAIYTEWSQKVSSVKNQFYNHFHLMTYEQSCSITFKMHPKKWEGRLLPFVCFVSKPQVVSRALYPKYNARNFVKIFPSSVLAQVIMVFRSCQYLTCWAMKLVDVSVSG